MAYKSDKILDLIKTSKRVTAIEEVKLILDWSVIVPLFKKLPLNFTKNYYFRWILPEDDGQVVMSMYKFGGYRGENVVLASSVKDLRKTLFRTLFDTLPVAVSRLAKMVLTLENVAPRGVPVEKAEVFKKNLTLIPPTKKWWYLKYLSGEEPVPEDDDDTLLMSYAGKIPVPAVDGLDLHDATVIGLHNIQRQSLFQKGDFFSRLDDFMGPAVKEEDKSPKKCPPKKGGKGKARMQLDDDVVAVPVQAAAAVGQNIPNASGFMIFRGVLKKNLADLLDRVNGLQPQAFAIFNHNASFKDNDMLRLQCTLPANWWVGLKKFLAPWVVGRVTTGWVGIISLPGCREQTAHVDWEPKNLPKVSTDLRPLGVLVALQNDATLNVWPGSHLLVGADAPVGECEKEAVLMNAGDVLLYMGGGL